MTDHWDRIAAATPVSLRGISETFETRLNIGDHVNQGDPVGRVGEAMILAPLTGRLRGLTRDGVSVDKGAKIVGWRRN